ncbi:MAG: hypothetical protein GF411_10605 [Candidatus Lokiarchaeota archaeon]|nr:hypothetical protein [Candidatus Lokiarchaeota archaeon]
MFELAKILFPFILLISICFSFLLKTAIHLKPKIGITSPILFIKQRGIVIYNLFCAVSYCLFCVFYIIAVFDPTLALLFFPTLGEIVIITLATSVGILIGLIIFKMYIRGTAYALIASAVLLSISIIPSYTVIMDYYYIVLAVVGILWVYVTFPYSIDRSPKILKNILHPMHEAKVKYGSEFPSIYIRVCLDILQRRISTSGDRIADVVYARLVRVPGRVGNLFRAVAENSSLACESTEIEQISNGGHQATFQDEEIQHEFSYIFKMSWSLIESEFVKKTKLNRIIYALTIIILLSFVFLQILFLPNIISVFILFAYVILVMISFPLVLLDPYLTGTRKDAKYIQKEILSEFVGSRDYLPFPGLDTLEPLFQHDD